LAKDDDVKAVVIRINSGGGDSFASEEIWHSVATLKEKKPVVISMSGAAASGAYYLSAPASWIVAHPTTITGSIGIFGVFPDMTRLYKEKLGLTFDNVKTNKHADMSLLQTARPFDAEEEALLRQYINRGYELFCKRVSDGRKMPIAKVKEIAEGRVWIAGDAMRLKLVDEIGGMPEAVKKAAELAKVKNYITKAYPTPPTLIEQLLEKATGNGNNLDEQMKATLGTLYEPFYIIKSLETQNPIQARCEYININEKTN
jgi:protease-4